MTMGLDWPGLTTDLNTFDSVEDSAKNIAADFAKNAVRLYQEESLWKQKQQQGYQLIKANFAKDQIQAKLLAKIADIQDNLSIYRSTNFIGQMLLHHQLKSTQYMAQWIEAKNKQ
jgi:hypothetical protein